MIEIAPPVLRPRASHPLSCLRFCGGLCLFLVWLAGNPAQAQTVRLGMGSLLVGPAAGTDSVALSTTNAWTNVANADWLVLSAANQSGTGSTNVVFSFTVNTNSTRSGTLTIAGQTLTVTQAGSNYVAAEPLTTLASSGLNNPNGVALDSAGNVYFADTGNSEIKMWSVASNAVTTLWSMNLNRPDGVAVDVAGNVYIADTGNSEIKEWIAASNSVTTLVDTGLAYPFGVAVDAERNVYIADTYNNAIKKWSLAGSNATPLVSGLNEPRGVAVDAAGNVYIADTYSNAIKEWLFANSNVITLVSSGLAYPSGLAVDGAGNVYIADTYNSAIKKWSAASGNVTTLVSSGLFYPFGAAVDGAGNVYIADTLDNAIKELPYAFVATTPKLESDAAGNDELPVALPSTENLLAPFAPASDADWLAITGITNDVVSFSFTMNDTGSNRVATITLLGQNIPVTQNAQLPSVLTLAAANINSSNAALNAMVNPEGAATTVYFVYGLTTNYGATNIVSDIGSGTDAMTVSTNVTGLLPDTVYHFEAMASSSAGTALGGDLTFTTLPAPPLATTLPATGLTSTNATLNASVNPQGSATTVYFVYGNTTNYGNTTAVTNIGSGSNYVSVSEMVTGLLPVNVYHFQAMASNSGGTTSGGDLTFTNLVGAPLAATQPATAVTSSNATLNAVVTPEGAATAAYFVYGVTTNYGNTTSLTNIGSGTNGVSVSNIVTGLLPATDYYFQAVGSNSVGTYFGRNLTFATLAGTPLATTQPATGISFGNATLNAWVNPQGAATTVYFVYGAGTNYGATNVAINIGSGINPVAVSNILSGLLPGSVYHFEVIAGNSVGTALGGDAVFTNNSAAISSLGAVSLVEGPAAGTNSVVLAVTPPTGVWTATANAAWLHLSTANQGGTGSANVVFSFDANTTNATRSNTLTIAGKTLTVTQAGSNYVQVDSVTALASSALADPLGVAVDTNGNVYFADTGNDAIKKWTAANNAVTTLPFTGLDQPWGVAVDTNGNVYIADSGNNAIKKWTAASNTVTNLVSSGLLAPRGVAVDGAGNVYIANTGSNAIMEWTAVNGNLITLVSSTLRNPSGVAVDVAGNVYIANTGANQIEEWLAADGAVTNLVSSNLDNPSGVAVDGSGHVYIANTGGNAIMVWMPGATNMITLVSNGMAYPSGVAVDASDNVYIANTGSNAVDELPDAFVDTAAKYETNAGGSDQLPVVLPATVNLLAPFAPFSDASWLTVSPRVVNGIVSFSFSVNTGTNRTAQITVLGQSIPITQGGDTFSLGVTNLVEGPQAGNESIMLAVAPAFGSWTASANASWLYLSPPYQSGTGSMTIIFSYEPNPGPTRQTTLTIAGQTVTLTQAGSNYAATPPWTTSLSSNLSEPYGVAVDRSGNVYIADSGGGAIVEWEQSSNTPSILVSNGLSNPRGVAVDGSGNLYISDYANNALYEWSAVNNTLTPLVSSGLFNPLGVAVDGAGNVYVADYGNFAIKEYSPANGNLTTLVSSGLLYPSGVAVDLAGNVYIADTGNNSIKKWSAASSNVTTLVSGFAGPAGLAVDGSGNVYIADTGHNAIKKWVAAGSLSTTLVSGLASPSGVAVDAARNVYLANTGGNAVEELPYAFVATNGLTEIQAAGQDELRVVLNPPGESLLTPFAPASSDTNWLTISGVTNGVVSFDFTAATSHRTAYITLLGQTISVTQEVIGTPSTLMGVRLLSNGVLQFAFTNNPNATFSVLSTTNLSLPLTNWTVLTNALTYTNGAFQFTSPATTNDAQLFYLVRSP
jgi:sugar lactone lactonase YvrE